RGQGLAMQAVIRLAIEVSVADPSAHPHLEVRLNGHQASVDEFVEIGAQKQAVAHLMGTLLGIREDMGSLQNRECVFAGDGTSAHVSADDQGTERSLTQAGALEERTTKAPFLFRHNFEDTIRCGRSQLRENAGAICGFSLVGLADHDVPGEAVTHLYPSLVRQVEHASKYCAADLRIEIGRLVP